MFDWFTIIKYLHILMAIVAVGFNASYGIWLSRAASHPESEPFALRTIKILDDRFANPAYGLLLVTGLIMVAISGYEITTLWILLALILYAIAVLLGIIVYSPTLRKQMQVLEKDGPGSATYRALSNRGRVVGIVIAVIVLGIVFLMVTKPTA
jgi:uncharacterized membrane protein